MLILFKMLLGAYLKTYSETDSKGRQIDERMKSIGRIRVQHTEHEDNVVEAYTNVKQRIAMLVSQN